MVTLTQVNPARRLRIRHGMGFAIAALPRLPISGPIARVAPATGGGIIELKQEIIR